MYRSHTHTHTHTRLTALFSRTTRVSRYQKGKTNLDFAEARGSEWQWHQLGHTQVCTTLQTDKHTSNPPLSFLQAGCPSCRPTNSVKAPKARSNYTPWYQNQIHSCCPLLSCFRVAYCWPLRADVTSFMQPEVHNLSHRCRSRTEPRP